MSTEKIQNDQEQKTDGEKSGVSHPRRSILKALVGVPVLGFFGLSFFEKWSFSRKHGDNLIKDLGLESLQDPDLVKIDPVNKGEHLRIGIIGWGVRGGQLSKALGFLHPEMEKQMKENGSIEE